MNRISSVKSTLKKKSTTSYNLISQTGLLWYYPFNETTTTKNISNWASYLPVLDASLNNYSTIANNMMTIVSPSTQPSGITINTVVPCSSINGISFSFWFCPSSLTGKYGFFATLQDVAGYNGGNRFYISTNPQNCLTVNGQYSTAVLVVNKVYHCVITISNPGNGGVVYLNNASTSLSLSYPSFTNVASHNFIGNDPVGNGFLGWIKQFKLYTRLITADEVNALYVAGSDIV